MPRHLWMYNEAIKHLKNVPVALRFVEWNGSWNLSQFDWFPPTISQTIPANNVYNAHGALLSVRACSSTGIVFVVSPTPSSPGGCVGTALIHVKWTIREHSPRWFLSRQHQDSLDIFIITIVMAGPSGSRSLIRPEDCGSGGITEDLLNLAGQIVDLADPQLPPRTRKPASLLLSHLPATKPATWVALD